MRSRNRLLGAASAAIAFAACSATHSFASTALEQGEAFSFEEAWGMPRPPAASTSLIPFQMPCVPDINGIACRHYPIGVSLEASDRDVSDIDLHGSMQEFTAWPLPPRDSHVSLRIEEIIPPMEPESLRGTVNVDEYLFAGMMTTQSGFVAPVSGLLYTVRIDAEMPHQQSAGTMILVPTRVWPTLGDAVARTSSACLSMWQIPGLSILPDLEVETEINPDPSDFLRIAANRGRDCRTVLSEANEDCDDAYSLALRQARNGVRSCMSAVGLKDILAGAATGAGVGGAAGGGIGLAAGGLPGSGLGAALGGLLGAIAGAINGHAEARNECQREYELETQNAAAAHADCRERAQRLFMECLQR